MEEFTRRLNTILRVSKLAHDAPERVQLDRLLGDMREYIVQQQSETPTPVKVTPSELQEACGSESPLPRPFAKALYSWVTETEHDSLRSNEQRKQNYTKLAKLIARASSDWAKYR